jgi:hypothetical protein
MPKQPLDEAHLKLGGPRAAPQSLCRTRTYTAKRDTRRRSLTPICYISRTTPARGPPAVWYPLSVLLALSVPADNDRGPQYMEHAVAAIHQANSRRLPMEFGFARHQKNVTLLVRSPPELTAAAASQLAAHYPAATISRLADDALAGPPGSSTWSAELRLTPHLFPIRRYPQFDDTLNRNVSDPLTAIFATLAPEGGDDARPAIMLTVRPASRRRVRRARTTARRLASPFFRAHPRLAHLFALGATSQWALIRVAARVLGGAASSNGRTAVPTYTPTTSTRTHDREDDLQAAADKLGRHLFEVHIRLVVSAASGDATRAKAQLRRMAAAFGQFTVPRMARFRLERIRRDCRPRRPGRGFLLSCEELATLWHPATATVRAPAMRFTESRELEPPVDLPSATHEPNVAVLGRLRFRGRNEVFGIRTDDRRRHVAIIGKTGMGKTTLLRQLIVSDMQQGRGLALVDPHGDLADTILEHVPKHRTNETIAFDAGDRAFPLAFNPLACSHPDQRPLVASGIVSALKKLYGESWGPRLEHILRNAVLALLEVPDSSLLSLQRLLADARYRRAVAARLADPVVRTFWQQEFSGWKPQYQAEAIAPVQNKLGHFLSQPILRAIVGQARSALDLRQVLDEGRILIVNLSKGRIGEDGTTLLGSLLVTSIQLAAMSRADLAEQARRDFFLYVDEFQNFATDSFATILSEARKYRLSLTLANQYLAQMEEATLEAVFGNVGSLLVFQVGARDAEALAEQLGGDATPQDLMALPRYRAYARLLVDGMPSRPFSLETLPPPVYDERRSRAAIVRRTSRHRYARPVSEVHAEIDKAFACAG